METNIKAMENILREHLVKEVKERLHSLIDNDIEDIAKSAVVNFLNCQINIQNNPMTLQNEFLFKFVQNITNTVVHEKIVKDLK